MTPNKWLDRSALKARRQWALRHPALSVDQLCEPGYIYDFQAGATTFRSVLSVDYFNLPLAWRADVGIIADSTFKPVALWTVGERLAAAEFARQLIGDDGIAHVTRFAHDPLCIGYERHLTGDEAYKVYVALQRPLSLGPLPLGAIAEYDFADKRTETGERSHAPQSTEVIYANRN